jgi:hypothetical protein
MPTQFMEALGNLAERTDEVIERALDKGGETALPFVSSALAGSIGGGPYSRPTGRLQSALGVSPVRMGNNGEFNIKIGFAENRSDGKRNAMLASILEHGKFNQPPRPFMSRAKSRSRNAVLEAMKRQFLTDVKLE